MFDKNITNSRAMATDDPIIESLENAGDSFVTGANRPFLLDDSDSFYFVGSGKVEVFVTKVEEGQPVGPRMHFLGATGGDGLFGMTAGGSEHGLGLLAVGIRGTRVTKLTRASLRKITQKAPETVARMLERWIARLSRAVSRDVNPVTDVLLVPNDEYLIVDGCKARSKKSIVWAKIKQGRGLFIGMEEVGASDEEFLLPISQDSWIQGLGTLLLDSYDTVSIIDGDMCWKGLDAFSDLLFRCEALNTRFRTVDEFNRLQQKTHYDRIARETALAHTAAILEHELPQSVNPLAKDALMECCRAIGKEMNITTLSPALPAEGQRKVDFLQEIAKASGFRVRKVALSGYWWQDDNGPLLGYLEADDQPVAILPKSSRSYEIYDPVAFTRTPLDEQTAATLSGHAYMFYRPFIKPFVKVMDLVKLGLDGCGRDLMMILSMGAIGGVLAMLVPIFTGILFDTVIPGGERGQLLQLSAALLVSSFAVAIFHAVRAIGVLRIEAKMDSALQSAVWDRILKLPVSFFRRFSAGDLAHSASGIAAMRQVLSGTTIASLIGGIFAILNFILLFYYESRVALVACGLAILSFVVVTITGIVKLQYQRRIQKAQGRISGLVFQLLSGIAKLKVVGAEGRAFAVWSQEFTEQKKMAFKERHIDNALGVFNSVFPIVTSMCLFATVMMVRNDPGARELSTGHFLAFFAAFATFLAAALQMNTAIVSIVSMVAIYEKMKPILESPLESDAGRKHPGELRGAIEISHVSFRYHDDAPLILEDVSLRVEPGEFIAIVGGSGSGKSTIVRLLLGLESQKVGTIYLDGRDLNGLDLNAVRRQIGVVLQNGRIMSGSIFENIVGSNLLTLADAWDAAEMAGLKSDIEEMPMGMHTVINEGGGNLSGGQRQRLLIARAVASKPRILIFDEATSALDNRTQALVSQCLEGLQATRIVIAHRLSTIENADQIYVVEKGRIIEQGVYEELMQKQGTFHALAQRQLS